MKFILTVCDNQIRTFFVLCVLCAVSQGDCVHCVYCVYSMHCVYYNENILKSGTIQGQAS